MDLAQLVEKYKATYLPLLLTNQAIQFGRPGRKYLGAELLPENTADVNPGAKFTETKLRFRTNLAVPSARYAPTVAKDGFIDGSFEAQLGTNVLRRNLNAQDYDAIRKFLNVGNDVAAFGAFQNWLIDFVLLGDIELQEKLRWEAIVNGNVQRVGINDYKDPVTYANPAGHRVGTTGTWSNNTFNPMVDIGAGMTQLASKGYGTARMITSKRVSNILRANQMFKNLNGVMKYGNNVSSTLSAADLQALLASENAPALEEYNLGYTDEANRFTKFLPENALVLVGTSGRTENIDLGDAGLITLSDTLGYVGVGKVAGHDTPGRILNFSTQTELYPYSATAEVVSEALPVITEPEAFYVITGIN